MTAWGEIAAAITAASGHPCQFAGRTPAGGGCINEAHVLTGQDGRRYFIKLNAAHRLAMFEAEAEGLNEILASHTLRVPRPVCAGVSGGQAWLVLEYLEMDGRGSAAALGQQLASMHQVTQDQFGWWRDNTIGDTPQINTPHHDWVAFWRDRRLHAQLKLAQERGAGHRLLAKGERLMADLDVLFADYRPLPSLLHGDLWGGNVGYCDGTPVVFDPAVYYGDREADLAMTELFGGFTSDFYAAYREAWPMDTGYGVRRTLYNVYHVLNHFNMFGGGYLSQAERMLERLLAEIGTVSG